jgi:hypothetical protein
MSLDDQPINWGNFYQAYTGLKFSIHKPGDCRVFVPTYTNIRNTPGTSPLTTGTTSCPTTSSGTTGSTGGPVVPVEGTEMTFRDEWSSGTFLVDGSTEYIDDVLLRQLWEYAQNNVLWDDFKKQLSFKDVDVEEITLSEFVEDLDTFLVFHKLSKFGDVWWAKRVSTDGFGDSSRFTNVTLSTTPGLSGNGDVQARQIEFWSPDKYVNDEYKTYLSDPTVYNGFLTSDDFLNGGWFSIPDLVISTKPFEKLKIADILLNLKFTYDPENNFGHFYTIRNVYGARIKDSTSSTVLDESQTQSDNNIFWADNLISHWTGGLISSDNIQNFGTAGSFESDTCGSKADEINYEESEDNPNEISHLIEGQMTLKPDYDVSKRDFLGTIDPINWRSTDLEENVHQIGVLNIDRAFGGASGTRDNGVVAGGISTNETVNTNSKTSILSSVELWSGNGFLKNILPEMNTQRCFHVQGGTGRGTCGVIGGFSEFNTDTPKEFSEWSKDNALSNLEVLISATDPTLSYFQTVSDLQLNVPRGDHAGNLSVETFSRQDKFDVEEIIKNFDLIEDDEQVLLEFVNGFSGETDNFVRYALSNVTGIVYGGSTTGRSNLITRAAEDFTNVGGSFYDEVIDIFEKINTTYLIASENTLSNAASESTIVIDSPQSVIQDVISIEGNTSSGVDISVASCGKYRLEYINGGFEEAANSSISLQDCREVIEPSVAVDLGDELGTTITAPYCGFYRMTLIDSTITNNNTGDERVIEHTLSVPGWDDFGPVLALPYAGSYRIEALEYQVENPDGTEPCVPGGITVDSSDAGGTSFVVDQCGVYRITYSSGTPQIDSVGVNNYYGVDLDITLNGSPATPTFYSGSGTPTSWNTWWDNTTDFDAFFNPETGGGSPLPKPYVEFCVDASPGAPVTINVTFDDPRDGDLTDNIGDVDFSVSWQGRQGCSCTDGTQEVEVIVNDNLDGIAFTSNDTYTFCASEPNSELRLRYKDSDYSDNNSAYGSVVVKVIYEDGDCLSSTNPGGIDVFVNGIYSTTALSGSSDLNTPGSSVEFCVNADNSELKFLGDGLWGGQANFELCFLGVNSACKCDSADTTNRFSSQVALEINGQNREVIFNQSADSIIELQEILESRPSDGLYDFCVSEPNSTINIQPAMPLQYNDAGNVNVRLLYLGESDCVCESSLGNTSTGTASIESREVTIKYVTVEENLRYPLRCHGMVYVGDNDSGLSTGGRTEYNYMNGSDGVIKRIFNKYSNGYQSIVDNLTSRAELEKDRVLDLVYELNEDTWVRKQNMLESVYWHCGVGDENRSIFWGGIHDALSSFSVTVNTGSTSGKEIDPDDFLCDDSTKTFDKNNISFAGTDYVPNLSGGPCWNTPIWESLTDLFSDPRFRNEQETLQYSEDDDYPEFTVISVSPNNPAEISPQLSTNVTVDHSLGTTIIGLSKTVATGGTFNALAQLSNSNNTTTGTFKISEAELSFRTDTTAVYPTGITSIGALSQELEFTNIQVFQDLTVEISYLFEESMTYDTISTTGNLYQFTGVGTLVFNSMQEIYESIIEGTPLVATSHRVKVLRSTEVSDTPFFMDGVQSSITFSIEDEDGIMVGVTTKDQEWSASLAECGPNIADFIELVADFTPIGNQRWGVPLWTQSLYEDVGIFTISSYISRRDVVDGDTNFGSTFYDTTTADISAFNYGSILNGRVLVKAESINQLHEYTAMNTGATTGASLPLSGGTECISANSSISITFPPSSGENSYTEWGTSFIQEYQSDQRYRAPLQWIPSNGSGLTPSSAEILYTPISWRRYMDGVGLGGDVPNYDSIYNTSLNRLRNVSNWSEIGKWHIGQMCFGDPNGAVIVGGHKVDDLISRTGIGNGYHSSPTTRRVFVWDLTDIPEEDSYLKNYMGRRMHTQYPEEGETFAPESASSLSSLSITIYQAESDIILERHGTILFDGSGSTQNVTFDTDFPDSVSEYQLSLTPNENIEVWWTDKSNTGFTANVEIENFTGMVDYVATATIKVTEQDITENDPLNGYIFYEE